MNPQQNHKGASCSPAQHRLNAIQRKSASASTTQTIKHRVSGTFANDRLQRLRKSLIEEVKSKEHERGKQSLVVKQGSRKRGFSDDDDDEETKCNAKLFKNDVGEAMEVDQYNEDDVVTNIRKVRETIHPTILQHNIRTDPTIQQNQHSNINTDIYIVTDTNVFLSNQQTVASILCIRYQNSTKPVVYVPWMVLQELDYIKDNAEYERKQKALHGKCKSAIRFINEKLTQNCDNFKGQSALEANEQIVHSSVPDDHILGCCIQLAKMFDVILLSNDVNLRNKALVNNIPTHSTSTILKALIEKRPSSHFNIPSPSHEPKIKEMATIMSYVLSFILEREFRNRLSDAMYRSRRFSAELPWSLEQCCEYFKENYSSVFRGKVHKQAPNVAEELKTLLRSCGSEERFRETCYSLLTYFKIGLPQYNKNIQSAIDKIKNVKS